MTLNQIHYFKVLAETENMHRAADRLFISQPSLTASIRNLENELGVPLFERTGRRIRLTREGSAFLEHAENIEAEINNARLHMEELSKERKTIISVGCIEPLLREYLPEKMRLFLQIPGNENVDFQVHEGMTADLAERTRRGELDFFLGSERRELPVQQTVLTETPLVLVCPKMSPGVGVHSSFLVPKSWEELSQLPLVGYPKGSAMDEVLERIGVEKNISVRFRYRMPNETAILSLVENGFGCAVIPRIRDLKRHPVDVLPLPEGDKYYRRICVGQEKDHRLRGAAAGFVEFLLN